MNSSLSVLCCGGSARDDTKNIFTGLFLNVKLLTRVVQNFQVLKNEIKSSLHCKLKAVSFDARTSGIFIVAMSPCRVPKYAC